MSRVPPLILAVMVLAWLAGCSPDEMAGPVPDGPAGLVLPQAAGMPIDISGAWDLSRTHQVTAPDWVAELIFGIEPEGPVTLFRCVSSGSMNLTQAGGGFAGTAAWTSNLCETKGGQVFSAGFPPITIEGEIRGGSVRFDWTEAGMLICPHEGVIMEVEGATAVHLSGTGRCVLPGHPLSPVPLDPPPAGTSKTLGWDAVRP
jgi:hypothetical protein